MWWVYLRRKVWLFRMSHIAPTRQIRWYNLFCFLKENIKHAFDFSGNIWQTVNDQSTVFCHNYSKQNLSISVYAIFGQGSCIPFKTSIAENLSRHPTTSVLQSSTYGSNIATLVIDGDKRTSEKYCTHTEVNQTKAWLQIDLGKPFNIESVKIFYRNEGMYFFIQSEILKFFVVHINPQVFYTKIDCESVQY